MVVNPVLMDITRMEKSAFNVHTVKKNVKNVKKDISMIGSTHPVKNGESMVLLMVGIVGLLLILTAVTCKHFVPCVLRKPTVQMKDSCRRPVEESGDDSLCSVKLYSKEP
ncbi:tumor necrosis factor receptor superfamily member 9-like protein [Lates japonicus]|uniref:Tumor necrosis factor receptor superfamily member 9-like protein n=1 Tax=Lates japonicus TaxID=270547 RepID=A0AAD3N0L9_LATJO|nr:tumor necrosis factor receptor superfamily member 9-like protein [Lates japonicus]